MKTFPIKLSKEITKDDDIVDLILSVMDIVEKDIIVIAQKIISKQEGRVIKLDSVSPSLLAEGISSQYQKDPRIVELILNESKRIVRMRNGVIIVETKQGLICANAGIDESNVPEGYATLLPINPDTSASKIRTDIKNKTGKNVAVIISDTFGRPFRLGQTNQAIGVSGIMPILDYEGTQDNFGRIMRVTAIAVIDEIAGTAELEMKKKENIPIVIIRDYDYEFSDDSMTKIIRKDTDDLFK